WITRKPGSTLGNGDVARFGRARKAWGSPNETLLLSQWAVARAACVRGISLGAGRRRRGAQPSGGGRRQRWAVRNVERGGFRPRLDHHGERRRPYGDCGLEHRNGRR